VRGIRVPQGHWSSAPYQWSLDWLCRAATSKSGMAGPHAHMQPRPTIGTSTVGFLVMGIVAYRTYSALMPLPDNLVSESGKVLFTMDDIARGQELYQARDLMEYWSVLGHCACLGPDHTAEYLRRATDRRRRSTT
jgi:hypothetical protein